jgi:hypothetical protein
LTDTLQDLSKRIHDQAHRDAHRALEDMFIKLSDAASSHGACVTLDERTQKLAEDLRYALYGRIVRHKIKKLSDAVMMAARMV